MNLRNVWLVWTREMRDQLRDRRTLFMVAVLPVLMYPLLGMSYLRLAQFMQEHDAKVLLIGAEQLTVPGAAAPLPPLLEGERFARELFDNPADADRIDLELVAGDENAGISAGARQRLASGELDAIVQIPPGFADLMRSLQASLAGGESAQVAPAEAAPQVANIPVLHNEARETSQVAFLRVERVLDRWQHSIVERNLLSSHTPAGLVRPFQLAPQDVATGTARNSALWSKLLLVVFIWALTGAFYPAIDLCAGEKERGTLEALLASPAGRPEIVCGKLLTVLTFSIFTALLNLLSLAATGKFVVHQLTASLASGAGQLALPSLGALAALMVGLLPIATLFSALSLACASLARSTKEGQYYFMPLFMALLPLMMLPMSPGTELNLGTALVPVTGMVLLMRTLIEGQTSLALQYAAPVAGVTLACCVAAVRWAVWQFHQESLLFSEGERFSLGAWFKSLRRDRGETLGLAGAAVCGAAIMIAQFLANTLLPSLAPQNPGFGFAAAMIVISQVACILLPATLLALALTRRPLKALRLETLPKLPHLLAGVGLAVALHPASQWFSGMVLQVYPINPALMEQLSQFQSLLAGAPAFWVVALLLAALPAVCEELAFRGAILTGLMTRTSATSAVVVSAVLFAFVHTVLQQSIGAFPLGIVLGIVAVRSGSVLPAIAMHATHNLLGLSGEALAGWSKRQGLEGVLIERVGSEGLVTYTPLAICAGLAVAATLLLLVLRPKAAGTIEPNQIFSPSSPQNETLGGGVPGPHSEPFYPRA